MMHFRIILFLLLIGLKSQSQEIIPFPNSYKQTPGEFRVPGNLTISTPDENFSALISSFSASMKKYAGIGVTVTQKKSSIQLVRDTKMIGKEAYRLKIVPGEITLEAGSDAGCFYGLQSLVQIFHSAGKNGKIACGEISDQPRYAWRGLMLDESRFFFGEAEVKKILDLMALHKLNKFHWHLTDSPGWRIEIKQYPLLTTIGAKGNHADPGADARYYSQKQISDIVQYAAERFIEVIPEIDMPGHATAAVKAYPEFSGGGSKKYPDFTFHPGKEETYRFLTNILKEVGDLFPSGYIHIGGDEVSFGNQQWISFPEVQQLMKRENIKDLIGVEHYFLNRMADSLKVIGKTMIGWDEVVSANLSTQPLVMWWRHDQPKMLDLALKNGYNVVLCPRIPLYFDFVQLGSHKSGRKWAGKFAPIESVYDFPSAEFTGGISIDTPLVLGIQANLWTETMHTAERLEFMAFPRLSALAESAWTNHEAKDFSGFRIRMKNMEDIYQKSAVTYFDFMKAEGGIEIIGPKE